MQLAELADLPDSERDSAAKQLEKEAQDDRKAVEEDLREKQRTLLDQRKRDIA